MSKLKTLIRGLATERGLEIDEDELDMLGLADDEDDESGSGPPSPDLVLSQDLPGEAAGQVEIFLAADSTATVPAVEKDDLMWYPIIREGQWAVRPGAQGKKKRVPLKIIAGHSTNQRRQIGLQDLKDAFDDEAIQHVTVPSSHGNTLFENQGFIKGMEIVDGSVKDKKSKKDVKVKVLMGGYHITEPDAKAKMQRGTFANRSAGILYDYVNTETGTKYPAVVEHVALTNKPWITGMASFGRKLTASPALSIVGLSLSDEGPDTHEYKLSLSAESELSEDDSDFLAQESSDWSKEGSPSWLRARVNDILSEARSKKVQAWRDARAAGAAPGMPVAYLDYDYPPSYRCCEAKPGMALISDGYGDDANHWSAPITVKDGAVELGEFTKWSALKKAFIPDDRPAPEPQALPLAKDEEATITPKTTLQLAQQARRARVTSASTSVTTSDKTDNNPREVVTQDMAQNNGNGSTLQLSEEAERIVQAAEARAKAAEERAEKLSEKVERLTGTVQGGTVKEYIAHLKDPVKGLGLSEEKGFGGVLSTISELMLADDGEPAVQGDCFAVDGNSTGELTLSDAIKRIFGALEKAQEGKAKLGDQLAEPADKGKPKEGETDKETLDEGKPPAGETDGEKLSAPEKVAAMAADNPAMAALLGGVPAPPAKAAPTTTTTKEGGN